MNTVRAHWPLWPPCPDQGGQLATVTLAGSDTDAVCPRPGPQPVGLWSQTMQLFSGSQCRGQAPRGPCVPVETQDVAWRCCTRPHIPAASETLPSTGQEALSLSLTWLVAEPEVPGTRMLGLTFGVIDGVHVPVDVALQVGMELGCGWEEGQADGHELPATG